MIKKIAVLEVLFLLALTCYGAVISALDQEILSPIPKGEDSRRLVVADTTSNNQRLLLDGLARDIATGYVPGKYDIAQLKEKYGITGPVFLGSQLHGIIHDFQQEVMEGSEDLQNTAKGETDRQEDALKAIALSRDRFDLSLGVINSYLSSDDGLNSLITPIKLAFGDSPNLGEGSSLIIVDKKTQFKHIINLYIQDFISRTIRDSDRDVEDGENEFWSEDGVNSKVDLEEIREHNRALLNLNLLRNKDASQAQMAAFRLIDSKTNLEDFQLKFLYKALNLLSLYRPVVLSKSAFADIVKVAVNLKHPNSADVAHNLLLKLFIMANRLSLGANTNYLVGHKAYPYQYSFSTGEFDIYYDSDLRGVIPFFLHMTTYQDLVLSSKEASGNSNIQGLMGNLLTKYYKFVKDAINSNFVLSEITRDRSVTKDVTFLTRSATRAVQSGRIVEQQVLSLLFNNQKFLIIFDSNFITYALDYILPRLKEGADAEEIVNIIFEKLSIFGRTEEDKFWGSPYSRQIYPSKVDIINRALGKFMFGSQLLAIAHTKIYHSRIGLKIRNILKVLPRGTKCHQILLEKPSE